MRACWPSSTLCGNSTSFGGARTFRRPCRAFSLNCYYLSANEKERSELLSSQKGRCAICGSEISRGEADHHAPLRDAIAGQRQRFRMLCGACHREVTDSVSRRQLNPISSAFNADLFRDFVLSPRPAQFVLPIAKIDQSPIVNVDVKRCRRSCLMEATEHWPVFSVHDEIHEVVSSTRNLSDFNWID